MNSLDDWGGAKKGLVLLLCGGPALLTIYVSSGAMLYFAIEAFVACFICHMLYGIDINPKDCAHAIAGDVALCILEGSF